MVLYFVVVLRDVFTSSPPQSHVISSGTAAWYSGSATGDLPRLMRLLLVGRVGNGPA
jgi:hypothetical protein